MRKAISFILSITIVLIAQGQNEWSNGMFNPEGDFRQTQEAFNNYWEGKTIGKGKGWKPFKRWEAFVEPRVSAEGTFPTHQLYQEWEKIRYQQRSNNSLEANWQAYGPTDVPLQSSGRKRGVGRINVIAFHPNNPNTIWAGTPAGGLWKTTDGGLNWNSNTDLLPNLGVSDIAIDPTNSDIMYIATGDKDGGDTYAYGILKSVDGGTTWNPTGLSFDVSSAYRANRILIHPYNTDILIASTRQNGGKVYRSTDAGASWTNTSNINLISMEFKPDNPNVIYGGESSNGGNARTFISEDNGQSWSFINNGLPTGNSQRVQIAVTPSNPDVVYALYANNEGGYRGLYKSENGGNTWNLQSNSPNLLGWDTDGSDEGGQGWYDLSLAVSPTNENLVFVGGVNTWRSTNGGNNFSICSHWFGGNGVEYKHADEHTLTYHPITNALYSGNDGGLYYSTDNGDNWEDISDGLQISQFYRIGISQTNANLLLAGAQDNGTLRGNNTHNWDAVRGGDGMECAVDPQNDNIMYSTVYYGALDISYDGGNSWMDISPNYDGGWITPFEIDPNNPSRIVAGYRKVYESNDYGASWDTISGTFYIGQELDVVALSHNNPQNIYVSQNSKINKTENGGNEWVECGTSYFENHVSDIAVHPTNDERVWATYSGFGNGHKIYKSEDGGDSWTNITANLPDVPTNCVTFYEPNETLFIGTDLGVWYRDSSMTNWELFNQGLPHVIINELEIQHNANKLYAATYGRGVWVTNLPPTQAAVANFSTTLMGQCNGSVQLNNLSAFGSDFEWDFGDGNSSTESAPMHYYTADGTYTITLIASNYLGSDTLTQELSISVNEPPVVTDAYSCTAAALTLEAAANTSESTLNWHTNTEGGTPIATGSSFTTPVLNSSNTYYVQESVLQPASFGGPADQYTLGSGGYHYNDVWGQTFNCTDATLLKSITFFAETNFSIEIELRDNNNNLLDSYTANLVSGSNVLELDFYIPVGNDYIIGINGENQGLWRNNDVNAYPIAVGNNISITESTAGEDYFYYFYNWEVQEFCSSAFVEVQANIGSEQPLAVVVNNNCPYDSLQLAATDGFDAYSWSNGSENSNITIYNAGVYEVIATDNLGCIATASYNVPYINSFNVTAEIANLCTGTNVYVQADNGYYNYVWNTGNLERVISVGESGTYSVTAEDANGCALSNEITLNFNNPLFLGLYASPNDTVCQGEAFTLYNNPGLISYQWNNGASGQNLDQSIAALGTFTYIVSGADENNCFVSDTLSMTIVECSSSISDWLTNPVNIFPNPTNGLFTVSHQSNTEAISSIKLSDVRGKVVSQRKVSYHNGQLSETFRLGALSKGVYHLQLSGAEGTLSRKIILQ